MGSGLNDEPLVGESLCSIDGPSRLVFLVQNEDLSDRVNRSSYMDMPENQVLSGEDGRIQYQLDSALVELEPKFSDFGSGKVLENDVSFYQYNVPKIGDSVHPPSCLPLRRGREGLFSGKKRKRFDNASQLTPSEDPDSDCMRNEFTEYEKEERLENKSAGKSYSNPVEEECIDKWPISKKARNILIHPKNGTEDENKNYVQVRAKRGEATSRHSLAERIRRERISERMKVLEDLVPGCDKITGKAIMLDEIINYVLSLQHQVEFLSMKLAALDPRAKSGLDQFPLEDIHHSQGVAATVDNIYMGSIYSVPDNAAEVTLKALAPNLQMSGVWEDHPR